MKSGIAILFLICTCSLYGQKESSPFITPEMFGVESDRADAARKNLKNLQRAIDYAIVSGKTLTSSVGKKYYIAGSLIINGFVNIDFGAASIIATDTCKMLLVDNGVHRKWGGKIRNIQLDMNGVSNCGVYCNNVYKLKIEDIGITGIKTNSCGLCIMKGYEIFVENMHCEGCQDRASGIVVRTHDCHFVDCVMIDCHTAVDCNGSNFFERIHAWIGNGGRWLSNSTFFRVSGGGPIFLHQCFSDTFDNAFDITTKTTLYVSQQKNFHNKIMWNRPDDSIHPVFIRFANEQIAKESSIHIDNSHVGGLSINNKNRQTFSNYKDTAITVTNSYIAP